MRTRLDKKKITSFLFETNKFSLVTLKVQTFLFYFLILLVLASCKGSGSGGAGDAGSGSFFAEGDILPIPSSGDSFIVRTPSAPSFSVSGLGTDDGLGSSISSAGDFDNDGIDDIIAGSPDHDFLGRQNCGKVTIISGANNGVIHTFIGENVGDKFGYRVAMAGDYNGDGKDDILISAPFYDGAAGVDCGKVYIYSSADNSLIATFEGKNAGDRFGYDLDSAGDYNGDGKDDIIVASPFYDGAGKMDSGKIYIYSGSDNALIFSVEGERSNDQFGSSVSGAGDYNNDGKSDVVIGAPNFDGSAGEDTGKVYIYSGKDNSLIYSVEGESSGDHLGAGVSSAGDYNCDGKDDIVVGAPNYDGNSGADAGKIYIYSGEDNSLLNSIEGEDSGDLFGSSVGDVGDYNNDGKDDIVVGAPQHDSTAGEDSGKIYVYSGADNTVLAYAEGESEGDNFGASVSSGGDYNDDGKADVLVGTPGADTGKIYVFEGEGQDVETGGTALATEDGDNAGEKLGFDISNAGDINGDGKADLLISAPLFDGDGKNNCGRVDINSGLDNSVIHSFQGENAEDQFGYSISTAGDYNGDGTPDIIIGAPYFDGVAGADTGKIYIYSGTDYSLLYSVEGEAAGDQLGVSVSSAGDYNGDGKDDIVAGASNFDGAAGADTGKVYVYSGTDNSLLTSKEGEASGDLFGTSVSTAGDYNDDGKDDIIVGAPSADGIAGEDSGKAYVYSGADNSLLTFQEGEASGDLLGTSVGTAGDYNGDGKSDIIIGASSHDGTSGIDSGKTYIYSGNDNSLLDSKEGENAGDQFGSSVSTAGDYNGDGKADVIVGAPSHDGTAGEDTGKVYVYSGSDSSILYSKEGEVSGEQLGTTVTTAGDCNADGKDDMAAGASSYDGVAGTDSGKIYTYSINSSPTVTVNQAGGQADPINSFPISYQVTFSHEIDATTFTDADIIQEGTANNVSWTIADSGDHKNFTLKATSSTSDGTVIPRIPAGRVLDLLNNPNQASTCSDSAVTIETVLPTVTINQKSDQHDPVSQLPIIFEVAFSESIKVSTFTTSDITHIGDAIGITWTITDSGDHKNYTLSATAINEDGSIVPNIAAGAVSDLAGNNNLDSSSDDNSVIYDAVPAITINQANTQDDPVDKFPISFSVVFSEAIVPSTFTIEDITQNGTGTDIVWNIIDSGDHKNFTLQAVSGSGAGTIVPSIAAGKVQDIEQNLNTVSTSTDNQVTYDTTGPAVTINQAAGQADPANSLPISYTVVFEEEINTSTFTTSDIVNSGTAPGITWSIIDSGNHKTFTLNILTAGNDGTIIPTINAGTVLDLAGNENQAATTTDNSVTYDAPPSVTINQDQNQADPTSSFSIVFNVIFSEPINPATFTLEDIAQNGTATGVTWTISDSGDHKTFILAATNATGEGTIIPSINAGSVQDPEGNGNLASTSTDNQVTYDITAPTITINQKAGQGDPVNAAPILFDVVFSEAINNTTFNEEDVVQNGTATGLTWSVTDSGDHTNFVLTATGITGVGTVIPSINAGVIEDLAGNGNLGSTSSDNQVLYELSAPTVSIEQTASQNDPSTSLPIAFDVKFNETINSSSFVPGDISQNGTASNITWSIIDSGDHKNFTLLAIGVGNNGTVIPSIQAGKVLDVAGNTNQVSTGVDNSVMFKIPSSVSINQANGQKDPASTLPISFTVIFNEEMDSSTFAVDDINQSGTATGITWSIIDAGNHKTFTIQATAIADPGTIIPNIIAGAVQDITGTSNQASTSTDNLVAYETTPPNVIINQANSQVDPVGTLPIQFNVTFSEVIDVTSFTVNDIVQNGTATGITWTITDSGDHKNFQLKATKITQDGSLIPSIAANSIQDLAGNNNLVSTSTDNTIVYGVPPKVIINQASTQGDPALFLPIVFNVVFSEPILESTFSISDITQNGTATGITWTLTDSGNHKNFILKATAVTGTGTLIPSIAAGLIQDPEGSLNLASTSTDNSVNFDLVPPTVTINQAGGQADPTATFPISFNVQFSEVINLSTFNTADIIQNGTAPGVVWSLSDSGDHINFILRATSAHQDGTIIPSMPAGAVRDLAGNTSVASTGTDGGVTFDSPPSVTINQAGDQNDPVRLFPIYYIVEFSEAINVSSFTTADITQQGTATGVTWGLTDTGNHRIFILEAISATNEGTVIPIINAGVVLDPEGNQNLASTSGDNSVTYDIASPTVAINQGGTQRDPTNTTPVSFSVVFNEPINPSTFTAEDVIQKGTATGVTWNITDLGDHKNFVLVANAISAAGTIEPFISASTLQDVAGNQNLSSTNTDNIVNYENTRPNATVNQDGTQSDPTSTLPIKFNIVFSEPVNSATFSAGDIAQRGTASWVAWTLIDSGDHKNYALWATAVSEDGTVIPYIPSGKVRDIAGNTNLESTGTDGSVNYDIPSTAFVTQAVNQKDPTNVLPLSYTVTFSEAIDSSTFTPSDIQQAGTASGIIWAISDSGDHKTFTLQAIAVSVGGTIKPVIPAGAVQDTEGSVTQAPSISGDNSVTYEVTPPTVTIDQADTQNDPTAELPITFDIEFSEVIDYRTFNLSDITHNGTATNITWSLIDSGDHQNYTLIVVSLGEDGTIIPSIVASGIQDLPGNYSEASTSIDGQVTYEVAPSITITQSAGQEDPAKVFPISFSVVFSEPINASTFAPTDITQEGTATGLSWSIIDSGNHKNFTLQATAATGEGSIVPKILADQVEDPEGTGNLLSAGADNFVIYDVSGPSISINQAGGQNDPTNQLPISFSVVFSEAINASTFTSSDISQSGTASGITWNIIDSGDHKNFTVQASAVLTDGTIIPSISENLLLDLAGNNNQASTFGDNSVTYDAPPTPTINQAVTQNDPVNTLPVIFDVTFSEVINPATFTTADITQNGTATGITWSLTNTGDDKKFTLQATAATASGTIIPSIGAGKVEDLSGGGNLASVSSDNSVNYDTSPLTITVNQKGDQADPAGVFPISFDVVFNKVINPITFTALEITQNGTATGVTWNIIDSGDQTNFVIQATSALTAGTIVPTITANSIKDSAGNDNLASTSTDNSVAYDITGPTATIAQAGAQVDPANTLPISFNVVFDEEIDPTTFTVEDITQNGTAKDVTWSITDSGDHISFSVRATAIDEDGTVIPYLSDGVLRDVAGNLSRASTGTDDSVTYNIPPSLTINQAESQNDPINSFPVSFTVIFSELINSSTFTVDDIDQNGTATGLTWSIDDSGDHKTFTLKATAATGGGTIIPSVVGGVIQDEEGTGNLASTSTDNTVTYDITSPTVTINQIAGQNDPTDSLPISFDVVFNEPINYVSFTADDITQTGDASSVVWSVVDSGDHTNFIIRVASVGINGTIIPVLEAAKITDIAGNDNLQSTSTDNSVTYDVPPTVTINQAIAQSDPVKVLPISFDVLFSEEINPSTFIPADITQNGTATGLTWTIADSGDHKNFVLQATTADGTGTLVPSLAAGKIEDSRGGTNLASTSTDGSVTYDITGPSVTVNQSAAQSDPISSVPISFDVVFNESINPATFGTNDITHTGSASGVTWNIRDQGDHTNFTLEAIAINDPGFVIPSIGAGLIEDVAGNVNIASTSTDNSVNYETTPPSLTIEQAGIQADPTAGLPIKFDVVFSEEVNPSTFTPSDITQNGTATGITWSITDTGDHINFTLEATAITVNGTVIPSLAAGKMQDVAGNANVASTSTDNSVKYNIPPSLTINQLDSQNDPTGTLPISFRVVFSEEIDPSTFTIDDITQNGTAPNVTWSITDAGDHKIFTVQATSATDGGTVVPSIDADGIDDLDGIGNLASTSTDNEVFYDTIPPTVTVNQAVTQREKTNSFPIVFDVVFSEAINPATFTTDDITHTGTATGVLWNITDSGDHINFTLKATGLSDEGTLIPSLAAGVVQDVAGNPNVASTSTDNIVTFTFDAVDSLYLSGTGGSTFNGTLISTPGLTFSDGTAVPTCGGGTACNSTTPFVLNAFRGFVNITMVNNAALSGGAWTSGVPALGNGQLWFSVSDTLDICSGCQVTMAGKGFTGATTLKYQGKSATSSGGLSTNPNVQSGGGGSNNGSCRHGCGQPGGGAGGGHAYSGSNGGGSGSDYYGRGGAAAGDIEISTMTIGGGGGAGYTSGRYGGNGGGAIKITVRNLVNNGTITAKGSNGVGSSTSCGGGGAGGSIHLIVLNNFTSNGTINADKGLGGTSCSRNGGNGSIGRMRIDYSGANPLSFQGIVPQAAYVTTSNNIPISVDGSNIHLYNTTSITTLALQNTAQFTMYEPSFAIAGTLTNDNSTLYSRSALTVGGDITGSNSAKFYFKGSSTFNQNFTLSNSSKIYGYAWSSGEPAIGNGILEFSVGNTLTICSDCQITQAGRGFKGATSLKYQGRSATSSGALSTSANGQSGGGGSNNGSCRHGCGLPGGGAGGGHAYSGSNGAGSGSDYYGRGGAAAGDFEMSTITIGGGGGAGYSSGRYGGNGGGAIKITAQNLINDGTITVKGNDGIGSSTSCGGGGAGGSIYLIISNNYTSNGTINADKGLGGTSCSARNGGNGSIGRIRIDLQGATVANMKNLRPWVSYASAPNNIPLTVDNSNIDFYETTSFQTITATNSTTLTFTATDFTVNGNVSVDTSVVTAKANLTINGALTIDNSSTLTSNKELTVTGDVSADHTSKYYIGGVAEFQQNVTLLNTSHIYGHAWSSGTPDYSNGIMEFTVGNVLNICTACKITQEGRGFKGGTTTGYQGRSPTGSGSRTTSANGQSGGGGYHCGGRHGPNCPGGGAGGGHVNNGSNGAGSGGDWFGYGGGTAGDSQITTLTIGGGGGASFSGGSYGGNGGGAIKITTRDLVNEGTITAKGINGTGGSQGCGGGGAGGTIHLIVQNDYSSNGTITADKGLGATNCSHRSGGNGSIGRIRIDLLGETAATMKNIRPWASHMTIPNNIPLTVDNSNLDLYTTTSLQSVTLSNSSNLTMTATNFVINGNVSLDTSTMTAKTNLTVNGTLTVDNSSTFTSNEALTVTGDVTADHSSKYYIGGVGDFQEDVTLLNTSHIYGHAWSSGAPAYSNGIMEFSVNNILSICADCKITQEGRGFKGGKSPGYQGGSSTGGGGLSRSANGQSAGGGYHCGGRHGPNCPGGGAGGGHVTNGSNGAGSGGDYYGYGGGTAGDVAITTLTIGGGGGASFSGGSYGGNGGGAIKITTRDLANDGTITAKGINGTGGSQGCGGGGAGGTIHLIVQNDFTSNGTITADRGLGATNCSHRTGGNGSIGRIRIDLQGETAANFQNIIPWVAYSTVPNNIPLTVNGVNLEIYTTTSLTNVTLQNSAQTYLHENNFAITGTLSIDNSNFTSHQAMTVSGNATGSNSSNFYFSGVATFNQNLTLSSTSNILAGAWSSGTPVLGNGMLEFVVNNTLTICSDCKVNMKGRGFKGATTTGYQGKSATSGGSRTTSANGQSGGGGYHCGGRHGPNCPGGGAGGGHVTSGANGAGSGGDWYGRGGGTAGSTALTTMTIGGGAGASFSGGSNGGNGGGSIKITAGNLVNSGTITAQGNNGIGGGQGCGGGGAGGSIYLDIQNDINSSGAINADRGLGATNCSHRNGGHGSIGRIRLEYTTATDLGTRTPTEAYCNGVEASCQ